MEGLVIPARRKLTNNGNLLPNNVNAHVELTGARRRKRGSAVKFCADERERRQGECVDLARRGHDDFSDEGGATGADSEGHVTGAVNQQQTMNALEMEEWSIIRRKKEWKVARSNPKIVVGARLIYKINIEDCEVNTYRCRLTA